MFRIIADNAARFLAAMLQGMQPERHEVRRIADPVDTEHPAFFVQFVTVCIGIKGVAHQHQGASESRKSGKRGLIALKTTVTREPLAQPPVPSVAAPSVAAPSGAGASGAVRSPSTGAQEVVSRSY
jgi:hypothetical protein